MRKPANPHGGWIHTHFPFSIFHFPFAFAFARLGERRRRLPLGRRRRMWLGDKPNSVPRRLPAAVMIISLDPPKRIAAPLARRWCDYYPGETGRRPNSLFCLAPHGVCRAPALALRAVGSYPAFSPLPLARASGGLFSVTLSVTPGFRPTPPRVLRGMLPDGVRTFLYRLSPAAIICPTGASFLRQRPKGKGKSFFRDDLRAIAQTDCSFIPHRREPHPAKTEIECS